MIRYDNKNWFSFLLQRGQHHSEGIFISLLFYGLLTSLLTFVYIEFESHIHAINPNLNTILGTMLTVVGTVIGLLLVFRTNTAYDRWWEGRKQLGALVNTTRNLALKFRTYGVVDHEAYLLISAFPWTMKEHLRAHDYSRFELYIPEKFREGFMNAKHKPNFLLFHLSEIVVELHSSNKINGEQLIILETEVNQLTDILGACERIRNTPIPYGYAMHLKRILLIYLFILPIGFVAQLHWFAPLVAMLVFYMMVGIELIGEEIEDPFGTDVNDLPFEELVDKIEANIEEIRNFK